METDEKIVNYKKITIISIIAIFLLVAIAIFFACFTRSLKVTVNNYIKAMEKGDATKMMSLIDFEASTAFATSLSNIAKFDETYEKVLEQTKNFNDEEKKEYENYKKAATDRLQNKLNSIQNKDTKYSIKNMKLEKIQGCDKLIKVNFTLVDKNNNSAEKNMVFYAIQKGFKYYLVSAEI